MSGKLHRGRERGIGSRARAHGGEGESAVLVSTGHNTGDMSFPVTGTHSGSVQTQHLCSKRNFY